MNDKQFFTLIGVAAVCVTAIVCIAGCVNTVVSKVLDNESDDDFDIE